MSKQDLIFLVIIVILFILVLSFIMPYKEKVIVREETISKIEPTKPVIALTFDDGPNYEYTIPILDILYEYESVATFFIVGRNIDNNKDVLKKIVGEGHEIANHTFDHYDLTTLNEKQIKEQISMTEEEVNKVIKGYSLNYVRPPYGRYNEEVLAAIEHPISLWSIDSKDWTLNNSKEIADFVIKEVKDGDVIILHDTSNHTIEATELILSNLVKKGYQFVSLTDLYEYRKDVLINHEIYR